MPLGVASPIGGTYDMKRVVLTIGGVPVSGFGPGDGQISIEPNADDWDDDVGCDGEVVRYMTNDRRFTVTVSFMPTSLSVAAMEVRQKLDRYTGKGAFALGIMDVNSGSSYLSPQAWIKAQPAVKFGVKVDAREYKIRCAYMECTNIPITPTPLG